jgi:mRNA interferase HigB
MRIIAMRTLKAYWERHPETREHIESWRTITKAASWKNPSDLKGILSMAKLQPWRGNSFVFYKNMLVRSSASFMKGRFSK